MKPVIALCAITFTLFLLFGLAGTVLWWNAWVFLAFMMPVGLYTQKLIKETPGLEEERKTAAAKAKPWDVMLVKIINLALPAMLLASALDLRFRWLPPVPALVSLAALALMIPATVLTYRSMAVNPFFSSHVRIQSDRGQVVVASGPYGVIRHPGYAGSAVFNLLAPLALGSWPTLIPGLATALILIHRTAREDRVLTEELPEYDLYAQQVRYRLVPGLW